MIGPHYKKLMGMCIVEPTFKHFIRIFNLKNPCLKCIVRPTCSKVNNDVCDSKENYYLTWAYIGNFQTKTINNLKRAWWFSKQISTKLLQGAAMTAFVLGYGYLIFLVIKTNIMIWGWNP